MGEGPSGLGLGFLFRMGIGGNEMVSHILGCSPLYYQSVMGMIIPIKDC